MKRQKIGPVSGTKPSKRQVLAEDDPNAQKLVRRRLNKIINIIDFEGAAEEVLPARSFACNSLPNTFPTIRS